MPYVDSKTLMVQRDGDRVTVASPFWTVTHDLKQGGAPVDIRFTHGQPGNILAAPLATWVDNLSDTHSPDATVTMRQVGGSMEIVFAGALGDGTRNANRLTFRTVYLYTPYSVRREVTLALPQGMQARRIAPLSAAFDDRFTHWSPMKVTLQSRSATFKGTHTREEIGARPATTGDFFQEAAPPHFVSLLRLGGEGIQIALAGDRQPWESPAGRTGQGSFRLGNDSGGMALHLDALAVDDAVSLPRQLTFAAWLTLVNLPAVRPAPIRTVMVGNPPFPADDLLQAWADSGVELIVIMEGAAWFKSHRAGSNRFWPINTPSYRNPQDVAEMVRLLASAHRCGMKVIPYTCPSLLHPEMASFHQHIHEWRRTQQPDGQVIYQPAGKMPMGVYGALVCQASAGWREFHLQHVAKLLTDHDFDGIYTDCIGADTCCNEAHGPARHSNMDGQQQIFAAQRELLGPDRRVVAHNGDQAYLAMTNNYADMTVTLESQSWYGESTTDMQRLAYVVRAFPACAIAMVPVSTWYELKPPEHPQKGLRDGLAKGALNGTVPYSYAMWEQRWGYRDAWECLRDERGIYALFRTLRDLNLAGLQFDDCTTGAVQTNHIGALGARYHGNGRQVVVIANLSGQDLHDVAWTCGGQRGTLALLAADEIRFIAAP